MSRVIPPSVTSPSPNEWTVSYVAITGITRANQAQITAPNHGLTNANDANITKIDFTQVNGMFQINGQSGFVINVVDHNNFTAALNTTNYYTYTSGGFANKVAGIAPYDPFENIA